MSVCVCAYIALSPTSSVRFSILSLSLPSVPALRVDTTCDNRAYHDTPRDHASKKGKNSKGKNPGEETEILPSPLHPCARSETWTRARIETNLSSYFDKRLNSRGTHNSPECTRVMLIFLRLHLRFAIRDESKTNLSHARETFILAYRNAFRLFCHSLDVKQR